MRIRTIKDHDQLLEDIREGPCSFDAHETVNSHHFRDFFSPMPFYGPIWSEFSLVLEQLPQKR